MTKLSKRRLARRLVGLALAVCSTLSLGCATALKQGDRAFQAGDLERARAAYISYLSSGRAFGDGESRARYRLGLSFALPGAEDRDLDKAEQALEAVIARDPDSLWARQASYLLSLGRERDRLAAELAAQAERADWLLAEVDRLNSETEQEDSEVDDSEVQVKRLLAEIDRLKQSVAELGDLLEAREQELEQIKRIDQQTPP